MSILARRVTVSRIVGLWGEAAEGLPADERAGDAAVDVEVAHAKLLAGAGEQGLAKFAGVCFKRALGSGSGQPARGGCWGS